MLRGGLIMLLILGLQIIAASQAKIEILNADNAYYDQSTSKAQILEGNVQIKYKDGVMYCDTAYLFREENKAIAFGRVHVNQNDTLNLYGDSLIFYGDKNIGRLRRNIKLIDPQMTLKTDTLDYYADSSYALYRGGGVITNDRNKTTLSSSTGVYYTNSEFMKFSDSVRLHGENYTMITDTLEYDTQTETAYFFGPTTIDSDSSIIYCEKGWFNTKTDSSKFYECPYILTTEQEIIADTIYYNRQSGDGTLIGNLSITDTVSDFIINGQYGEYNQHQKMALITGNPLLTQIYERDSLLLTADTLRSLQDKKSEKQRLYAFYNVKFYKSDLQGKCDSLYFNEPDSSLQLYYDPIIWSETNQVSGNYMELLLFEGQVHELYIDQNSFIISEVDSSGYNQIKGKELNGYFDDENQLERVKIIGNGQTLYFAGEEGQDKIGLNRADCSNIYITLDSNEVKTIHFITEPEAVLIPMEQIREEDLKLKDFHWDIHLRPKGPKDLMRD